MNQSTPTTLNLDNLSAASPHDIDAAIAEIHERIRRHQISYDHQVSSLRRLLGQRQTRVGRRHVWEASTEDTIAQARAFEGADGKADSVRYVLERVLELRELLASTSAELEPFGAQYEARRWSRFFQVPGGHIHSSTHCSTCNHNGKPTEFGWITEMSGRAEADVVAEHGALLCTVCYPSAPVEWTNQLELAKAAREAEYCSGSGTGIDRDLPHRTGYYSGNWVTCPACQARVGISGNSVKVKKHKPAN